MKNVVAGVVPDGQLLDFLRLKRMKLRNEGWTKNVIAGVEPYAQMFDFRFGGKMLVYL